VKKGDEEAGIKKRDEEESGIKKHEIQKFPSIVRARISVFQQRIDEKLTKLAPPPPQLQPPSTLPPPDRPPSTLPPPDSAQKVVLYLTSLCGIRKTYEDC
jgi:glutaredoxin domain-containing cysteine-rich protein 1